jgi:hypothetical protein
MDHFKQIYRFASMLVLAALGISIFILIRFGERYVEQILTFWMYAGAAAGVQAVTGISISNMKRPQDDQKAGTTTAEISVTTTTEPKKEGGSNE